MFILIRSFMKLLGNLIPILECIFLSFTIGRIMHSPSTAIFLLAFSIISVYFWSSFIRIFLWGFLFYLFSFVDGNGFINSVFNGLIVAGLRFGVTLLVGMLKK